MTRVSIQPREIPDTCKEAVVDGLLNNLAARTAGLGDFYRTVVGARPSGVLVSGFIVPRPLEERDDDEEANPMRISAHGLDFQIGANQQDVPLQVKVSGSIYLRILPEAAEVAPGGPLYPRFPVLPEARAVLRQRIRDGLAALRAQLNVQGAAVYRHPEWASRSQEIRRAAHAALGIPFDDGRDAAPVEAIPDDVADAQDVDGVGEVEGGDGESPPSPAASLPPDAISEPINPPEKWIRLDLELPGFEFTTNNHAQAAQDATDALKAAIEARLAQWFDLNDPDSFGRLWGYRRNQKIRPSDLQNWDVFLARARADLRRVVPEFDLRWAISVAPDALHTDRLTVHVALENWTPLPSKVTFKELECSLFQVGVSVAVPKNVLQRLTLERVKPSYRYNTYLHYPALGFNGGVRLIEESSRDLLITTWTPRYVLPRIQPREVGVELRFDALATREGLEALATLIQSYNTWLAGARATPIDHGTLGPLGASERQAEEQKLTDDVAAWEAERDAIGRGLQLLRESASHWSGPGPQADMRGIPFEAWSAMNAAMVRVGAGKYDAWRLFQAAFILAMIPAFASRVPAFHHYYQGEAAQQANAVTLLYFATGGGKSEAFMGLLLFVVLLDRLRGKERGISALMRYPLRLLTLQQARRTMSVLAAGELERRRRNHPGEPFSLGFWVGGANTPNWHSTPGVRDVWELAAKPVSEEPTVLEQAPYANAREQWLKLEQCPFCRSENHPMALRRAPPAQGGVLGHYCSNPRCEWNRQHATSTPLPFYIVDEDIYGKSPSVLLGTVDKLAVIGQSFRTIRAVFGMFGFAPFRNNTTGMLVNAVSRDDWSAAESRGYEPLFPAFAGGTHAFFDPFPSLLIQDEAHLLEESLGTFAGLFESSLEAALEELAPSLGPDLCLEPVTGERRRIKVVAASATVSEPQRQMRNLYQRDGTIQFPYPGPDLYTSFYSEPRLPDAADPANAARLALEDIELKAHGARTYAAIVTNGHRHTMAMAAVLGQYHLLITELYEDLRSEDVAAETRARAALIEWLSPSPLQARFRQALETCTADQLLSLVDLHRIALTYVTNKKGGDQVIDTERMQFDKLHQKAGREGQSLRTELISGAVSASQIQAIVRAAEMRVPRGDAFPDLSPRLRSIIATSAVSHGVDVEEFNAMFFAGLPSDIAEYIQASSRVGRTHAGFSLLVPVPQRSRDRFVVEIFDIFHRFLERMVLPAAIDRWAEKAIQRVIPSAMQEYLCGVTRFQEIAAADLNDKRHVPAFSRTEEVLLYLEDPTNRDRLIEFVVRALGLTERPPPEGAAYYENMVRSAILNYKRDMQVPSNRTTLFRNFFEQVNASLRPMTSLRDVDRPGWIFESSTDASHRPARRGETHDVMAFIQRGVGRELDADVTADEE
jgi:hypothetical protein